MIIWDKGFTRPVETELPKEEETVVSSSFSVPEALEGADAPIDDSQKSTKKGTGKQ